MKSNKAVFDEQPPLDNKLALLIFIHPAHGFHNMDLRPINSVQTVIEFVCLFPCFLFFLCFDALNVDAKSKKTIILPGLSESI